MNRVSVVAEPIVSPVPFRAEFFSSLSHNRILALPMEVEYRSLTTLLEKPVKIGAKAISHGR